jgi:hypothetical protein
VALPSHRKYSAPQSRGPCRPRRRHRRAPAEPGRGCRADATPANFDGRRAVRVRRGGDGWRLPGDCIPTRAPRPIASAVAHAAARAVIEPRRRSPIKRTTMPLCAAADDRAVRRRPAFVPIAPSRRSTPSGENSAWASLSSATRNVGWPASRCTPILTGRRQSAEEPTAIAGAARRREQRAMPRAASLGHELGFDAEARRSPTSAARAGQS